MRKILALLIAFTCILNGKAQLKQGEWRDHLPFNEAVRVAIHDNFVFCGTQSGLLIFNRTTSELNKMSTVHNLSDVEISTIDYSEAQSCLVIGYKTGNIDLLMTDGSIENMGDIKRKSITASKSINRIENYKNFAYLACNFGIVVVDLAKKEIKESYFFGAGGTEIKVNDIAISNNFIYAATPNGIYKASLDSPNLIDYNNWLLIDMTNFPTEEFKFVEYYNNQIFAVYTDVSNATDRIITLNENNFQTINIQHDKNLMDMSSSSGYLCLSGYTKSYVYNSQLQISQIPITYNIRHIVVAADNNLFLAGSLSGFSYQDLLGHYGYYSTGGMAFREVNQIATMNNRVWVGSGGSNNMYTHGGAYLFTDNKWTSYNSIQSSTLGQIGNFHKFAIDPKNETHVMAGTYGYGIVEFKNDETKLIDQTNTDIFSDLPLDIRVVGIQYDRHNNLWVLLDLLAQPLFKLNANGTWERPKLTLKQLSSGGIVFSDLLVTSSDQIWISTIREGIVVIQENDGVYKEKSFLVRNDNETLSRVNCLEEDNEGDIWVGTNSGTIAYLSPDRIFDTKDVIGWQYIIPRNDGTELGDYFLSGESVLDITTDGANRKWLATELSGAILINAEGKEVLSNFREENSPLLANQVAGIGINEISGEVFFATSQGLISYQGVATEGYDEFLDVYVYPNPVRPDFKGNITITGLIENTLVKITDISGNLVYETYSLGGQAIWNGHNFDGQRVASGVYLVFLTTEDGLKTHITKLVFIH